MNETDRILLWVLAALSVAVALLRVGLARKQEKPMGALSLAQTAVVLVTAILYQTGRDIVFPALIAVLAEELICSAIRRRKNRENKP